MQGWGWIEGSERQPEVRNSRNCDHLRARGNRKKNELLKPRVWAILAEAEFMIELSRSCGIKEETSSARNATNKEKEGKKYSGIFLPLNLFLNVALSPATASQWPIPGQKPRKSTLQGSASLPNRDKLGKKGPGRNLRVSTSTALPPPSLQMGKPFHFESIVKPCACKIKFASFPSTMIITYNQKTVF